MRIYTGWLYTSLALTFKAIEANTSCSSYSIARERIAFNTIQDLNAEANSLELEEFFKIEVDVEGVVIADFQTEDKFKGFFLQAPAGVTHESKFHPGSSQSIFISSLEEVSEGDFLRIKGRLTKKTVSESFELATIIPSRVSTICGKAFNANANPWCPVSCVQVDIKDELIDGELTNFNVDLFVSEQNLVSTKDPEQNFQFHAGFSLPIGSQFHPKSTDATMISLTDKNRKVHLFPTRHGSSVLADHAIDISTQSSQAPTPFVTQTHLPTQSGFTNFPTHSPVTKMPTVGKQKDGEEDEENDEKRISTGGKITVAIIMLVLSGGIVTLFTYIVFCKDKKSEEEEEEQNQNENVAPKSEAEKQVENPLFEQEIELQEGKKSQNPLFQESFDDGEEVTVLNHYKQADEKPRQPSNKGNMTL